MRGAKKIDIMLSIDDKISSFMTVLNRLSLKSLYMLSAVANSKDMQQAARKLCISQSALSHQMLRLEQRLGQKLFFKEGRHQKLLPEVKLWANELHVNFAKIESSTDEFLSGNKPIINFGVPSAFAFNRVTPSLGLWLQSNPDLDVRVRMLNCEDIPQQLNLDAILSTPFKSSQYTCDLITPEKYIPVCSPLLLERLSTREFGTILNSARLLELNDVDTWKTWSEYFAVPLQPISTVYFSHTILLLQSVLSGQGIALLDYYLVKRQLEEGQLVQLYEQPMIIEGLNHSFSVSTARRDTKEILKLKEWLMTLY